MLINLRPKKFTEFIGQRHIKQTLKIMIKSASIRKKNIDHILFHGSAGLGKTSLATIIANESKKGIKYAQGPQLEKKADILSLLSSISDGDIVFIDEIHGINKSIEELLYSALEDGVIDVVIGTEGDSKILRMKLPSFTMVGATTKYSKLSTALKDRFGYIAKFSFYTLEDMESIIKNSAKRMKIQVDDVAIKYVANHSRFVPRVANNLLKRIVDFATVYNVTTIDKKIVKKTFKQIGMYPLGLNEHHISYLTTISSDGKKYVTLNYITSILDDDKFHIQTYVETPLLQHGLIIKNSSGRKITEKGLTYLSKIF